MPNLRKRARASAAPVALVLGLAAPGLVVLHSETAPEPLAVRAEVSGGTTLTGMEEIPSDAASEDILPTMPLDDFDCRMPRVDVDVSEGCDVGLPYPACAWRVPEPQKADHAYSIWRNTAEAHRSARPALVSLVLAVAAEYARRYPGEVIALGDLDAPGPRHETHDHGVDVDVYLPGMMEVENLGGGDFAENYAGLTPLQKRMHQGRVETLARIFAACSSGRVRILYNDPEVRARFLRWYEARGLSSPFGAPMQKHNDLHRFHFHVSIAEDLDVLPVAPLEVVHAADAEPPAS